MHVDDSGNSILVYEKTFFYSMVAKEIMDQKPTSPASYKFDDAWNHPTDTHQWRDSIRDEFDSMLSNKVWKVIEREGISDADVIDNKWVFKHKLKTDGTIARYKSRLVARGFRQQYGVNYLETFAPVARFNTIRLLFAFSSQHALRVHQMDAKTAFLCADIDIPIYMKLPEGFEEIDTNPHRQTVKDFKRPILRILKGIYGIKQAPRLWNKKLTDELLKLGFTRCEFDHSLYIKHKMMILVYVDDILVAGRDEEEIHSFKNDLSEKFEMTDMGEVQNFLNLQVIKEISGDAINYGLTQSHYIPKILEEYNMQDCKFMDTPMAAGTNLLKRTSPRVEPGDPATPTDKARYQRLIGSLMYLMLGTRPDIAFALSYLSQFAADPSVAHWRALKRVLRYLAGTKSLVLWLDGRTGGPETQPIIYGISDADWASDKNDRKSVGAYMFYYNNSLISWCSKKQAFVSTSTCESEYMAASFATKEAVWIQSIIFEINLKFFQRTSGSKLKRDPVLLFMDNMSAIRIAKNPEFYSRSKHIDIAVHFIRQRVDLKQIDISFMKTEHMTADYLTKPLPVLKFVFCREKSGLA